MGEYQEEVLSNILDLQAELRGDEPEQQAESDPAAQPRPRSARRKRHKEEALAVTDGGVTVSVPSPADETAAHDRLAALNDRLAKLESHLTGVTERIRRIEPAPERHATGSTEADADADANGVAGSFLDLQKIVADRLDSR